MKKTKRLKANRGKTVRKNDRFFSWRAVFFGVALLLAISIFGSVMADADEDGNRLWIAESGSSSAGTSSSDAEGEDDSDEDEDEDDSSDEDNDSDSGADADIDEDEDEDEEDELESDDVDDEDETEIDDEDSDESLFERLFPTTTTKIENRSDDEDDTTEDEDEDEEDEDEDEQEIDLRLSETERIRVRVKDGEVRVDITSGGVKTRLERRDDRVIVKAEREDGFEFEVDDTDTDDTLIKIEDRLEKSGIKIATGLGEKVVVQRGSVGAVAQFPLSIELATNTLFIETPSGQQQVRVLPDQAVKNMLAANVVSRIASGATSLIMRTTGLTNIESVISLGEEDGQLIYEIDGVVQQKLLGFIPVGVSREVTVSADSGEVVDVHQGIFSSLLDLLSV